MKQSLLSTRCQFEKKEAVLDGRALIIQAKISISQTIINTKKKPIEDNKKIHTNINNQNPNSLDDGRLTIINPTKKKKKCKDEVKLFTKSKQNN